MHRFKAEILLDIVLLLIVISILFYCYFSVYHMGMYSDEIYHWPVVESIMLGRDYEVKWITTFTTYHKLVAYLSQSFGISGLHNVRIVNIITASLLVPLFYYLNLITNTKYPIQRTVQMVFLPSLFLYYFVLYTDVLSLLILIVGVCFLLKSRHFFAALLITASVFIRQTNLIFLAFGLVYVVVNEYRKNVSDSTKIQVKTFLNLNTLYYIIPLISFAGYFLNVGNIAMGDQSRHEPGLYIGNLVFCLFLNLILFLPFNISAFVRNNRNQISKFTLIVVFLVCALFISYSRLTHDFNVIRKFLRNDFLMFVYGNHLIKLMYIGLASISLFALFKTKLKSYSYYLIYLFCIIALIPAHLIEHRYSIPFLILYLAFREDEEPFVENLTASLLFMFSLVILYGVTKDYWFL